MAGLVDIEDYEDPVVNICPHGTSGEVIDISGLLIQLPKVPSKKEILFHDSPKKEQYWRRTEMPTDLKSIRSMDEWAESPREFRNKYTLYIQEEFKRRREGCLLYTSDAADE